MTILDLVVESRAGRRPLHFRLERLYNLGFAMHDQALIQAHIDEMAKEGIRVHGEFPLIMQLSDWIATTAGEVTVQRGHTSGEVEFVLLRNADGAWLGLGSDHTDRELERTDIPWSKQVCPNVIAPTVWPLAEVTDHWAHLEMACDVVEDGQVRAYQRTTLDPFMRPAEIVERVRARIPASAGDAFFSGTVATVDGQLRFAHEWRLRLTDPVLGRSIEHRYRVIDLSRETAAR